MAKYKYQLLLLVVVILCYFPLTFFQSTLLNDDIDVALSTKYFAGECFHNGILPLWNPYQIWGFPAHADLQYTNWNCEVLLTGILFGYTYITLHLQFMLYLFLGALGSFLLFRHLSKQAKASFYIACVYVLSGMVTAHVQSLVTILGIVWLPYVILYFLVWLKDPSVKHTILLSLFAYLLVTLGYQAFAFMLLPPFVVLVAYEMFKNYRENNRAAIKRILLTGFCALVTLVILLSPVLITQLQSKPFVARLNGMSVNDVMSNPFSPAGMLSLINPLLTIGHDAWFNTDLTMRNIFIGTLPLLLLVTALFKKQKNSLDLILLSFAVLYLLGSFGDILPVRKIMYYLLPGFKLFRFPSLLRVVAILLVLCYWAVNINRSIELFYNRKRLRMVAFASMALLYTGICAVCFYKTGAFTLFKSGEENFNQKMVHTDPLELAFYTTAFQLFLIAITAIALHKTLSLKQFKQRIALFTLTELTVILLVYGQFTAFTNLKPPVFQDNFAKLQKGFPFPSKDALTASNHKFNYITGLWKNTGGFKKQLINNDAWTSFYFMNYDRLNLYAADLKDSLQSYPFIYFSRPQHELTIQLPVDSSLSFLRHTFHSQNAKGNFTYKTYSPNNISLTTDNEEDLILNLQQSYFTGWSVKIDGIEQTLLWNTGLLMSVRVPQGQHTVNFTYQNATFVNCLVLSYGTLVLLVILLIALSSWSKKRKLVLTAACLIFTGLVIIRFVSPKDLTTYLVKNTFSSNASDTTHSFEFNSNTDIRLAHKFTEKHSKEQLIYSWQNYYNTPELLYSMGFNPDKLQDITTLLNGKITYSPNNTSSKTVLDLYFDNTYNDLKFIDTTRYNGYSLKLNDLNPYTVLIALPAGSIAGHRIYGSVNLKNTGLVNANIVCNIKHANGVEESLYFPLNKYMVTSHSGWQSVPYYFETRNKVIAEDRVNLFLMNPSGNTVYVKHLKAVYFE